MKHKILPTLIIVIFSCCHLQAQIQKGSLLLGGSFAYNAYSTTSYSSGSNASVIPRISYAIGNNTVIGLSGNFSYTHNKSIDDSYKGSTTGYGGSLFIRKYLPIQSRLGWYAEANGSVIGFTYKSKYPTSTSGSTSVSYALGAVPGIYFQALPRLIINANVGGVNFSRNMYRDNNGNTNGRQSQLNVNFLSSFTFGVDFVLNKKSQS